MTQLMTAHHWAVVLGTILNAAVGWSWADPAA
jgi:hypothetical protein